MRKEKQFGLGQPHLGTYAQEVFRPLDKVLNKALSESEAAGLPSIQVGPMDGLLLELLVKLKKPQKIVEIGTLGGYSCICLARGAGRGATIWTLDKETKHLEVAKRVHSDLRKLGEFKDIQIQYELGSALESLSRIESQGPFDLVFIDADKGGYVDYLAWASRNLAPNGVIIADNTLAWGEVHRAQELATSQPLVAAIDRFNRQAASLAGFRSVLIPTAEGLTLLVKEDH